MTCERRTTNKSRVCHDCWQRIPPQLRENAYMGDPRAVELAIEYLQETR